MLKTTPNFSYRLKNDELTCLTFRASKLTHLLQLKLSGAEVGFKHKPRGWYIHYFYPAFTIFIGKWKDALRYINNLPMHDQDAALSIILDCGKDEEGEI